MSRTNAIAEKALDTLTTWSRSANYKEKKTGEVLRYADYRVVLITSSDTRVDAIEPEKSLLIEIPGRLEA